MEVKTYTIAQKIAGANTGAASPIAAKFSLPVSAALMLVHGRNDPEVYTQKCIDDPLVQSLAAKVVIKIDPKRDEIYPIERGAAVCIQAGGKTYNSTFDIPKGDPENPLSDEELSEKFESNAHQVMSMEKAARIRETLFDLENQSLRGLMRELRP